MYLPFVIAGLIFLYLAIKGRGGAHLGTLRNYIERYRRLCRQIAAERLRSRTQEGDERGATLARVEALERDREKAERTALRLRETLLKGGFALDGAQLTTVEEEEALLLREQAEAKPS